MNIWMIWFVGFWVVESLLQAYNHGKLKSTTHYNFWEYTIDMFLILFPLYMMVEFGGD